MIIKTGKVSPESGLKPRRSSERWRSFQLGYPDQSLDQARMFPLILVPYTFEPALVSSVRMKLNTQLVYFKVGIFHYKISREKLEPEPGFEPRTSGFLARRSAT